jgi:integrase
MDEFSELKGELSMITVKLHIKKGRPNYFAIIRYKDDTGKERQKWETSDIAVKGNNKRKAEQWKDEVMARFLSERVNLGVDINNNEYFVDFIKNWLETLKITKKIQVTTHGSYLMTLNQHILPYFEPLKLKVSEVEPKHIQAYVNYKMQTLSPNTLKKHMANISACLKSAMRQNIIPYNPAERIEEIRKVKYTGAQFLNEDEIERILGHFKGDPLETAVLLSLFYGLRRSEVLGLKWDAVDFDKNTISIKHTVVKVDKTVYRKDSTKNASSNDVLPLPTIIKVHLLEVKAEQKRLQQLQPNDYCKTGYICAMPDGSPMKPDYISQRFRKVLKRNNLPLVRFHDIRHSTATYLKHLGFDLRDIQAWLRHADIKTTMMYTHLDMTRKTDIAQRLDSRISEMAIS